jgi:hypothetical protein
VKEVVPIADATVGVKQDTTPDRLIDNESLVIGGQTVYRQRVKDPDAIAVLNSLLTELGQKLEPGGEVALAAATLAALESVTATIANWPADFPDAAVLAKLEAVRVLLAATLTVQGTVALDSATLAALEQITVTGPLTDAQLRASAVSVVSDALTNGTQQTKLTDGTDIAEVNARTDGIKALEVADDFTSFEANHQTLTGSTDTTVTFAQTVRLVVVQNWDTANRVLVRDAAITSNTDSAAARVGFAPAASVPGKLTLPFKTASVHLRSAGSSEVTVIGFF